MDAFLRDLRGAGARVQVTSTDRSYWDQARLWADWIAGRRRDRPAMPGSSKHEYGSAFDFVVTGYQFGSDRAGERQLVADAGAYWLKLIVESNHFHAETDGALIGREAPDVAKQYPEELYGPVMTGTPFADLQAGSIPSMGFLGSIAAGAASGAAAGPIGAIVGGFANAMRGLIGSRSPLTERRWPDMPELTEYLIRSGQLNAATAAQILANFGYSS